MVRQNLSFTEMPISSAIVHQPFFEMPRPAGGRNRERVSCSPQPGPVISSCREWRGSVCFPDGFSCTRPGRHGDSRFRRRPSGCRACLCSPHSTARHVLRPRRPWCGRLRSPAWEIGLPSNGFFSAAGQIIYFRDIIREVFEGFIKICKKWVAIKATHPIKMEFSKLLLHRLHFWSFLRQAHHYVVP